MPILIAIVNVRESSALHSCGLQDRATISRERGLSYVSSTLGADAFVCQMYANRKENGQSSLKRRVRPE